MEVREMNVEKSVYNAICKIFVTDIATEDELWAISECTDHSVDGMSPWQALAKLISRAVGKNSSVARKDINI